jgi:hypothetical protein
VSREHIDYTDFVSRMTFRFIDQDTYVPKYVLSFLRTLDRVGISFEFINTHVPCEEKYLKERMRNIFTIRKKSTLALGMILNNHQLKLVG